MPHHHCGGMSPYGNKFEYGGGEGVWGVCVGGGVCVFDTDRRSQNELG